MAFQRRAAAITAGKSGGTTCRMNGIEKYFGCHPCVNITGPRLSIREPAKKTEKIGHEPLRLPLLSAKPVTGILLILPEMQSLIRPAERRINLSHSLLWFPDIFTAGRTAIPFSTVD